MTPVPGPSYVVGQQLSHHAGDIWEVIERDLPGDGSWGEGMILLAGDYRIRCIAGREVGRTQRVHSDYLHGDGWRRRIGGRVFV